MTLKEDVTAAQSVPASIWQFAAAEFDEPKWELRVAGQAVEIEPRPLEILLCLLRHAGEAVTKEELLEAVWGHTHLSENALSNAIGKLRKALGDDRQAIIATVHRVGYRLGVAVRRRAAAVPEADRFRLNAGDPVPRREGWRLVRPLGGTMGTEVWLAARGADEPQRVFKFSPDGTGLGSLKHEATLFRLLHDALGERGDIARVLDWSFEQAPFFIECEYGGQSLPEWADAQGGLAAVPLESRLELLAAVADAVAAAHSVGVLHKDLKPDNILVYQDAEGRQRPRLTDFGSGQLTDPSRLAAWGTTQSGLTQPPIAGLDAHSGTPLYLAPELLRGHAPTVQSDIYALGLILFQLAVGDLRQSMAPGWESQVADELLREDIAEAARGDPERRLPSARELALRLRSLESRRQERLERRMREAQALAARRALQRARARRPWLAALLVTMATGLALSLWFFRQSSLARDEALREFDIAQAVNGFLDNDLLAAANPNIGGSTNVTVLQAVRKAADKIDQRFAGAPTVALALHRTVGNAYRTLGSYAEAETEFRRALAIARAARGAQADTTIDCELLLAQLLAYESRYREAQELLDEVDAIGARRAFDDPMIQVRLWDVRALLQRHRTDVAAAAAASERALAALDLLKARSPKEYEANAAQIFFVQLHIAQNFQDAGRRAEAERIERELIARLDARRSGGDPLAIRVRQQLVDNLIEQKRVDEAAALLPSLVQDAAATLGGTNRVYLNILRTQALVHEQQGQWPQALEASRRAEEGYSALLGADNDTTVRAMLETARILAAAGQGGKAIAKYLQAYAVADALQGRQGPLTQLIAYDLAQAYLDAGQAEPAGKYLQALSATALSSAAPGEPWSEKLARQRARYESLQR